MSAFLLARHPALRPRRLRAAPWRRRLVAETVLTPADLVWPLFVIEGEDRADPVPSLPGVARLTIDRLVDAAESAQQLGIPAVALFPAIDGSLKDARGSEALNADNLVCRAVRALKARVPDIGVICDVALDPYTDHGHDGVIVDGRVDNDATVAILREQALVLARAGCDVVAPSDMMDGRVGAIRQALEAEDFTDTLILSYAVKYASAFYGPFRDAVGSSSALARRAGPVDKHSYQMDPANSREALVEAALDTAEGADMLMVKPAGTSLDVIAAVSAATPLPVLGYQVSGEYAAIKLAAEHGALDGPAALRESLVAIKRAGARAIFTYAALDVARDMRADAAGQEAAA
ncbi:MAG: porphobilinogen synthase [Rhodospirillaceae bacterium]|nr:porphobilinogen synthase [Rhodospirillaceae bacterium]